MKRIIYYVVSCTSEENQNGVFHYSDGHRNETNARVIAVKRRGELGNEGHVAIEKHYEIYENNEWRIDHEGGGSVHIDYL